VLYLSPEESEALCPLRSPTEQFLWRVVSFDQTALDDTIDFSHEREWRVPGDVDLSGLEGRERHVAIVRTDVEAEELRQLYPITPDSVIRGVFSLFDLRVLG